MKGGMFEGGNPLVLELAKDLRRNMTHAEMILLNKGYDVLRFSNNEITKDIKSVLAKIESKAEVLLQNLIINQK